MTIIKIKLKCYDHRAIERSADAIRQEVNKIGAKIIGPIPLPVENSYCLLNNSPHIDKRSMTKMCISKHSRLLKVSNLTSEGLNQLNKLELCPGVDVNIEYDTSFASVPELPSLPKSKDTTNHKHLKNKKSF